MGPFEKQIEVLANHPADDGVKVIVDRYLRDSDKPMWKDWLSLPTGKEQRLKDLYGMSATRNGDWLTLG